MKMIVIELVRTMFDVKTSLYMCLVDLEWIGIEKGRNRRKTGKTYR